MYIYIYIYIYLFVYLHSTEKAPVPTASNLKEKGTCIPKQSTVESCTLQT